VVEGADGTPDERRQVLGHEHRHQRDATTDDHLGEPDDDEELGERPPDRQQRRRHHERAGHSDEGGGPRLPHADSAEAIDEARREIGTPEHPGQCRERGQRDGERHRPWTLPAHDRAYGNQRSSQLVTDPRERRAGPRPGSLVGLHAPSIGAARAHVHAGGIVEPVLGPEVWSMLRCHEV